MGVSDPENPARGVSTVHSRYHLASWNAKSEQGVEGLRGLLSCRGMGYDVWTVEPLTPQARQTRGMGSYRKCGWMYRFWIELFLSSMSLKGVFPLTSGLTWRQDVRQQDQSVCCGSEEFIPEIKLENEDNRIVRITRHPITTEYVRIQTNHCCPDWIPTYTLQNVLSCMWMFHSNICESRGQEGS